MYFRLIYILLIISSNAFSQKKSWDLAILEKANTAVHADYLTPEEKAIIFYLNLVRLDPKLFGETFLKKYLDSTSDNNQYTKSLRKTLSSAKPLPLVYPDKLLSEFAKEHAIKFGKENKIGHGNYSDRIKKIKAKYRGYMAENCDYGNDKAFDIVMSLLIDENVPGLGHRKNILDPEYKYVGISIQPHKRFEWNCVMNFGG